jgi:hypothetical protein
MTRTITSGSTLALVLTRFTASSMSGLAVTAEADQAPSRILSQ